MQFMLMDYVQVQGFFRLTQDEKNHWLGAYRAYLEAMRNAGILKSSNGLHPASTAATVRVADGKTQVLDGPYAETKEQLGGYYLIEAETLDAAIEWAARCPGAAHGAIEVRPLWQMTA
jgi:hypothetical protein